MVAPPSPDRPWLSRRQLLDRGLRLGGSAIGAGLLAACRPIPRTTLLYSRGELPEAWLQRLPPGWQGKPLAGPSAVAAAAGEAALLQLGDGWATDLPPHRLAPLGEGVAAALAELDPIAAPAMRLFGPADGPALAFPWAFGTWVLLLRNRADLLARRAEGWRLLLDPSLRRRLVLPSSPRLVIDLAARQLAEGPGALPVAAEDGRLSAQLRRLRQQALAFDEPTGLNLLLAGDADAAVVPSQRVVPLLRRDPRLSAFLPASGSPLWWNLLLRPANSTAVASTAVASAAVASAAVASTAPLPAAWLALLAEPRLLERLLAGGWLPPLPRARLAPALARWPAAVAELLLPPAAVLARCSNLPPLTPSQRQQLQALWDGSAPLG
ncbi:MAG: hypothetical protein R6W06_12115 [Prochlorococcaceae cyanobacterium]